MLKIPPIVTVDLVSQDIRNHGIRDNFHCEKLPWTHLIFIIFYNFPTKCQKCPNHMATKRLHYKFPNSPEQCLFHENDYSVPTTVTPCQWLLQTRRHRQSAHGISLAQVNGPAVGTWSKLVHRNEWLTPSLWHSLFLLSLWKRKLVALWHY